MLSVFQVVASLTVGLAFGVPAPQGPWDVELTAVRFYRADVGTVVEGLCRVPFGMLEPVRGGPEAFGVYRLGIVVRDSAGLALVEESWSQRVPANVMDVSGSSAVEHFRFAVPEGRYTIEVSVTDSASGLVKRSDLDVAAFNGGPPVSDLLLSAAIRQADSSSVVGSGEISRGGFFITAQTVPVLTPSQAQLFYYLELYPGVEATARLVARIVDQAGTQLVSTPGEAVAVSAAGVAASGLNLAGLPPGEYRVELAVEIADSTMRRSAPFRMAGFETEAAIARAVESRAEDVLAHLTEDQLDTLYAPLVHIMEGDERSIYDDLSAEGKRNYLREFWARRDPTPATPDNPEQERFYATIAYANREYRESGAGDVPGWRTDRGRILIRYGQPDEVLRRPAAGPTPPYEVWKFTSGRLRKFVFLDQTRLGNYVLLYTDERREPSIPNWEEILGPEAAEDVKRF